MANFISRRLNLGPLAVISIAAFLFTPTLLSAYKRQLSEDDVREAYLFGQRHDLRIAKFFDAYEKKIAHRGKPGDPRVRAIGVRTPYSAAVLRSYQGGSTYTGQQAWRDYNNAAAVFEVVVWIDFPINSNIRTNFADPSGPILRMFPVKVISEQHELASRKTTALPQYFGGGDSSTLTGAELHFEFDVTDVASASIRVQVSSQFGGTVTAEFDLSELR